MIKALALVLWLLASIVCAAAQTTVSTPTIVNDAAWTPADGSGASLTFTSVSARYSQVGKQVLAMFRLTYPSTVNASVAVVSGLPVAVSNNYPAATNVHAGACWMSGASNTLLDVQIQAGATSFQFFNNAGTNPTNNAMSTAIVSCVLTYISQ